MSGKVLLLLQIRNKVISDPRVHKGSLTSGAGAWNLADDASDWTFAGDPADWPIAGNAGD